MAESVSLAQFNPLGNTSFNFSSLGQIFIIIFVSVLLIGLTGLLIWLLLSRRQWKIRIPLYKIVGNTPTRIATLKAKVVPIGRAGDVLWFAKGSGIKKFIPPAEMQSAANEYPHFVREDGEWVNFVMSDIDEIQKKAGVKYVKTDMRLQRLATDKLLEQRHLKRGFLEKWGVVIGFSIFFLIITISLVIFFHQYSKVVDQLSSVIGKADEILTKAARVSGNSGSAELTPAFISVLWYNFKRKVKKKNGDPK